MWINEYNGEKCHDRVLITAPYMMKNIDIFTKFFNTIGSTVIVADVGERLNSKQLEKYNGKYDIAITGDDEFTEEIIRNSGVKRICKWGTGVDSIDADACKKYGVQLFNTPNAFTIPVSQSIIGVILGYIRNIDKSDAVTRYAGWEKVTSNTVEEVNIGVIGFGNIGKEVVRILNTLGGNCRTIGVYDVLDFQSTENYTVFKKLDDLMCQSNILCLCCTYNPTSHYIINKNNIIYLYNTYLINTSRGKLIEEEALIQGLTNKNISGAFLDVFENEPLEMNNKLRLFNNVKLSSHNTNSSPYYWDLVHINTIRNVLY
jgi:D-3-phosphoglycerate dehydrogenase